MSVAYLVGGRVSLDAAATDRFYESYASVRRSYAQAAAWTGLTVAQLRTEELPFQQEERQSRGSLRQSAYVLGLADVLAEEGIRPDLAGGISLGGMTSSCLAGAIEREAYLRFLHRQRAVPLRAPELPEHAVARAFFPVQDDPGQYYEPARSGVHLAGDFGPVLEGTKRMLLLGGERAALEALAAELPERTVLILEGQTIAAHTPLRDHETGFMAPYVDAVDFADPVIPLYSSAQPEPKPLATAGEVREMFLRNPVAPISMPGLLGQLERGGARLGVILGNSIPKGVIDFPFPVVHLVEPEDIEEVRSAVAESAESGANV